MIFNMNSGGEAKRCPVLAAAYPADASVFVGTAATFTVAIAQEGKPNAYTYQWYVNGAAVAGATGPSYTRANPAVGTFTVHCAVTNKAGTVTSRVATLWVMSYLPSFAYTGSYTLTNDSGGAVTDTTANWRLRLLTSGTLTFYSLGVASALDVFLVGGGGGGGQGWNHYGGGGGGGYTLTARSVQPQLNQGYAVAIGAGGGADGYGGNTSVFGVSASGGACGGGSKVGTNDAPGGNGGSGGGGYGGHAGGSDGGNGSGYNGGSDVGDNHGGAGQGTTTREFGESGGTLYSGGGGGGKMASSPVSPSNGGAGGGATGGASASANTGGGGGGCMHAHGPVGAGGSGIVVIRNKR